MAHLNFTIQGTTTILNGQSCGLDVSSYPWIWGSLTRYDPVCFPWGTPGRRSHGITRCLIRLDLVQSIWKVLMYYYCSPFWRSSKNITSWRCSPTKLVIHSNSNLKIWIAKVAGNFWPGNPGLGWRMASLVACKREKDVLCLMIGNAKRFDDL